MPSGPELRLRPPEPADEEAAREAHRELAAEGFGFLFSPGLPWARQLAELAREAAGEDLPTGRVPATYLLAEVEGQLVGRVSIRHRLNDDLLQLGGHVGYAVRPRFRRRGYATAILLQSLGMLRELGVQQVLVTCDEDNVGSAAVIERCGGVLEDVRRLGAGPAKRRYWITVSDGSAGGRQAPPSG